MRIERVQGRVSSVTVARTRGARRQPRHTVARIPMPVHLVPQRGLCGGEHEAGEGQQSNVGSWCRARASTTTAQKGEVRVLDIQEVRVSEHEGPPARLPACPRGRDRLTPRVLACTACLACSARLSHLLTPPPPPHCLFVCPYARMAYSYAVGGAYVLVFQTACVACA